MTRPHVHVYMYTELCSAIKYVVTRLLRTQTSLRTLLRQSQDFVRPVVTDHVPQRYSIIEYRVSVGIGERSRKVNRVDPPLGNVTSLAVM